MCFYFPQLNTRRVNTLRGVRAASRALRYLYLLSISLPLLRKYRMQHLPVWLAAKVGRQDTSTRQWAWLYLLLSM